MAAYHRGDCSQAEEAFLEIVNHQPAHPTQTPMAIHHLARCEKRQGRCGKALPWYEDLLSRFPSYEQREAALWETAQCHRKLGHLSRARTLLETLSTIPAWKTRAVQELNKLQE